MSLLVALCWALIYIAVVCTVGYIALWFMKKIPNLPSFVPVVIQVVVAIICLIIILNAFVPGFVGNNPHLLR